MSRQASWKQISIRISNIGSGYVGLVSGACFANVVASKGRHAGQLPSLAAEGEVGLQRASEEAHAADY